MDSFSCRIAYAIKFILFTFIFSSICLTPKSSEADTLYISPTSPVVEPGQEITLSVSNSAGELRWIVIDGTIIGNGKEVIYQAPETSGIDAVTVLDEAGSVGSISITVGYDFLSETIFLPENANIEIWTNRKFIDALLISDDKNLLWVGTRGGLEKRSLASGKVLEIYTTRKDLPGNDIRALLSDGKGGVWIGMFGEGLAHFDENGEWNIFNSENSDLPDNDVWSLLSDQEGGIWIGTYGGGLVHMEESGQWTLFESNNSQLPDNNISSLFSDGKGGIWIGTFGSGIAHTDADGKWTLFNTENSGLPDNQVWSVILDANGVMWAGTNGAGIARMDQNGSWQIFNHENSTLPNSYVLTLLSDGDGGIWAGTDGGGLAHMDKDQQWQIFTDEGSELPVKEISTLVSDSNGGIWIGTFGGGLAHLEETGKWLTCETYNAGLPNNDIPALVSDGKGGMFIATDGGGFASKDENGNWKVFNSDNSRLPTNFVHDMLLDNDGGIWIATWGGGLVHKIAEWYWQIYSTENSDLPDNTICTVESDGNGGVWAGTNGKGVVHIDKDNTLEIFNTQNSELPNNYVFSLLLDEKGEIWIGTDGGGLAHRDNSNNWKTFDAQNSDLPDNWVRSLISDNNGGIWIGTLGGGLVHKDKNGNWDIFNTQNSGIPQDNVSALLSDGTGGVWAGTLGGGVARKDKNDLWTIFNSLNSGLPNNNVLSLLSDETGGVWVGTSSGLGHLTFSNKPDIISNLDDMENKEKILNGKRAAILVHTSGSSKNPNQSSAIKYMAAYAYHVLNIRGYDNSEIYFLSYTPAIDFNMDGVPDVNVVDAPVTFTEHTAGNTPRDVTEEDIQTAFEWAKTKGMLDQPLFFIFVDHGAENSLVLDSSNSISSKSLASMLDDYQAATGNQIVIIIEASHSGTVIDDLSGFNRTVISSADDSYAYYDGEGQLSFIRWYFNKLKTGMDLEDSFLQTREMMENDLDVPFNNQKPGLDDNGDGVSNSSADGILASHLCLNGCWASLSREISFEPDIESSYVNSGDSVNLSVKATVTSGSIQRITALIITPETAINRDQYGFSKTASPLITLKKSQDNVYSGFFSSFPYKGVYTIVFIAEDNDGFITDSVPFQITCLDGPEYVIDENSHDSESIIVNKEYSIGEDFTASLAEINKTLDLYAALTVPEFSEVFILTDMNQAYVFSGVLDKWKGDTTLISLLLPEGIPKGEYTIYLLKVPAGSDPLSYQDEWLLEYESFDIL